MCQIVSGHRSDVENLPTSRRLIRNSYPMDSAIKLPCAGLNKVPVPPDEPGIKATGSSPHLSSQCPMNAVDHSCFICSRFLENGLSNLTISSPNSDTTPLSVFKVLRRSTQPAHLLVFSAVIVLAILFYPSRKANLPKLEIQSVESTLWPLLYLSSFSILFGAQMWMTFVSGLVLLFVLPRHTFACVQSALFPKYMILNGITALAVLISFVETKKVWSSQENYQVIGLIINCLCPLLARVVVVPTLLERIKAKVILERAAGHGPEAGPKLTSCTEAALKKCSTYRQTCRRFRQLHAVVAIVNIVTLACNAFHLYYLASKIAFHH